ncbi:MAG: inorganic phosphate transporter [Deltaproteobacteria bacterium]|nr:inorganic phosphate transporter [Deltaproteobacteria bacterium]
MTTFTLLVLVVVAALVFDFINGFHDTANAIATVVSTGVLKARTAVLFAAVLNLVGAFMGTAVASTIGKDLLDPNVVSQHLVFAALIGAIVWNLLTWWFGIPSSSSHALVGGLVGAAVTVAGPGSIQAAGVEKVLAALVLSPIGGFGAAFVSMIGVTWAVRRIPPTRINVVFRRLQLLSSGFMALSHGTNDAQKSMGVITMALLSYHGTETVGGKFPVPTWVVVSCAVAMGLGTAMGGWRIIHTMGSKIFKLRPIHGCVAETAAASVIQFASVLGVPTSTTHCITSAIMGAGATTRLSAVSWGVTRRILWAWVLTIPASALCSAGVHELMLLAGI